MAQTLWAIRGGAQTKSTLYILGNVQAHRDRGPPALTFVGVQVPSSTPTEGDVFLVVLGQ